MDRLAEYAQHFPGMVDEDFLAAGFTPEEISSYRSQINPQVTPFVPRPEDTPTQGPTSYRTTAPKGGYADIYRNSFLARKKEEPASVGFARDYMDFLPGIGDVIGAGEVAQELTSEDPNYPLATALGAATVIGAVPVVGDFVARAVAKTAQNVFDSPFGNKVLDYLRSVKTDAPGRPPLTFDEVEAAMKAEAPAKPTAAELRRQANIQRFGYDPSEVVERTPTDDAGFEAYLEKVNPGMKRIAEEARPNLMMGDMYGMMPKGSEVVGSKGNVTFHRSPDGEYYATSFNPDVSEEDVIGYIIDRGDGTELAVVSEMQGQGVGGELQYLFRKENPNAPTGGLTEAGEGSLRRTYERLADEGIVNGDGPFGGAQ